MHKSFSINNLIVFHYITLYILILLYNMFDGIFVLFLINVGIIFLSVHQYFKYF